MEDNEADTFQQDAVPPRHSYIVLDILNDKVPGLWTGRQGPISWCLKTPDLSHLDSLLWGYVKNSGQVY